MANIIEKKKKVKNKEAEEEAKDRLSDLSDDLLFHIFSFLPDLRWIVRSCVLSKRWECLWTSIPDLILPGWYDREFQEKFVTKVLSGRRNNLPVRVFRFNYFGLDKSLISRVINYAASHNVQHFSINAGWRSSLRILFPIFNGCRSLKTLSFAHLEDLHLLEDISLRTLTNLNIHSSTFPAVESTHSIDPFVGLVNLKSLSLSDCRTPVDVFKISGPELHSLFLTQHRSSRKVEIFAPKLHSFKFIDTHALEFSNLDFPLLETSSVMITSLMPNHYDEKSHLDLINLFRGLRNAQAIYISSWTIESLMKFPGVLEDQGSPFCRLKTLNVISKETWNVETRCKGEYTIPNTIMNYFGPGYSSGLNINIEEDGW